VLCWDGPLSQLTPLIRDPTVWRIFSLIIITKIGPTDQKMGKRPALPLPSLVGSIAYNRTTILEEFKGRNGASGSLRDWDGSRSKERWVLRGYGG